MASRRNVFQKKYIGKDYVAMGSNLVLDREKAWEKISRRARRAIEKARELPLRIEKKAGTKEDLDHFRTIWYDPKDPELGDAGFKENQHVYFAYREDELMAGVVVTEVGKNLFLHFNGGSEEARDLQIPSLMIWHVVEQFHDTDFEQLDIGCSFRPSLQQFFKNWATSEYPILYHPPYLTPRIDITPFDSASFGADADASVDVDAELARYFGKPFTHFPRGTYALYAALHESGLKENDEVFVTTTTGSPYISSCVTTTLDAVCGWSRMLSEKTRAILVIHEFGKVHPRLKELKLEATKRGIALIEDCAYAYQSADAGAYGDLVIYSFPKFFPVQYGGLLVGKALADDYIWKELQCLDPGKRTVTRDQLSRCIKDVASIADKRRENYAYLNSLFREGGLEPYFMFSPEEVPGAYLLKVESAEKMRELASRLEYYGIECGAFHHHNAVFLPIHQNLTKKHLDYIFGVVRAAHRVDGWVLRPDEYLEKMQTVAPSKTKEDSGEVGWKQPF